MRSIKLICAMLLSVGMILGIATVSVSASEGSVLHSLINPNNAERVEENRISYGLDVIASQKGMIITGITGNALNFSAERFACALNLSRVDSITVTELPSTACGGLYIGSEGVSVGQKIKASDIALMTYEEAGNGLGKSSSFNFKVNDSTYEICCSINMIEDINYSPTLSLTPAASLICETYRDVTACGVLSAYDPEGDEMVFEIVKYPENGRAFLENESMGTYTYVPGEAYTGTDSFTYVVYDKYGNYSEAKEVNITISAPAISTVYSDLLGDGLYAHAIAMTENGLMNGIQVGDYFYFEADREVTRAEFIVTAMNAVGIKNVPEVSTTVFADDREISKEMKGYIALAYSKGYISGKNVDGALYFDPNETIKLSEAAVIVSNMIGYAKPKVSPVFADANEIPSWSETAIESLYSLGILELPDMKACANDTITRGDMAKLLNRTKMVMG